MTSKQIEDSQTLDSNNSKKSTCSDLDESTCIDDINDQAWGLRRKDPSTAVSLSEIAYQRSYAINYKKGMAYSLRNISLCSVFLSNYSLAFKKAQEAILIFEDIADYGGMSSALNSVGLVLFQKGEYSSALKYFFKSLSIREELSDLLNSSNTLMNIGAVYEKLADYSIALTHLFRALKIKEHINDRRGEALVFVNIANVLMHRDDSHSALEYYKKSLKVFEEMDDLTGISTALLNQGEAFKRLEMYDESIASSAKGLEVSRKLGNKKNEVILLNNLGDIHLVIFKYEEAKRYYEQGLELAKETSNNIVESSILLGLGRLYINQQNYMLAVEYLEKCLEVTPYNSNKDILSQLHKTLAECCEKRNETKKALYHYKKYHSLHTEVFNKSTQSKLKNLFDKLDIERANRETEIYRLRHVEMARASDELKNLNQAMEILTSQKSQLLEQYLEQSKVLERHTHEDGLTGLFNRRYLDTHLSEEFERAKRYNHPLSLAIIDVDHFKSINDNYSHIVGDEVLKHVAEILKRMSSHDIIVARYGGEEFVAYFLNTIYKRSIEWCELARQLVLHAKLDHISNDLKISISVGIADEKTVSSPAELISLADQHLYKAKRQGRNCVVH